MKIVETTFERLPRERLEIGFEGENLRATVRIDCASVFAEYPNATPTLIVKPLFADAYPVVVDRNGTDVDWLITSEILSFTGDGEIQLVFYKDEVICKSAVSKIRVSRSLTVTGEMPDPVVQWIENANRKLAEVDAQIVELEGMVDTATDAATRAQQSESTASTKAEQAAGSAATATEKATEATNAAGTATSKAAEAALSATQARNSAVSAANSESGATAKAAEAAQSAQTAAQKAEQITEAAQIATGKAEEASASATAAQASATNAASSATAAQAAQTVARASETAAGASATQAGASAQNAGIAAQTATQKAAEATQSATGAAQSEQTATQKAGEAETSAQAAQDAQTAAEGARDTAQTTVSGAIAGIQAEGQTQIGAVQSEGTTQVGNVNAAGTTQVGAVQAKGTEVINSIPSDYTELSDDVSGLKSALDYNTNRIDAFDGNKSFLFGNISKTETGSYTWQTMLQKTFDLTGCEWLNVKSNSFSVIGSIAFRIQIFNNESTRIQDLYITSANYGNDYTVTLPSGAASAQINFYSISDGSTAGTAFFNNLIVITHKTENTLEDINNLSDEVDVIREELNTVNSRFVRKTSKNLFHVTSYEVGYRASSDTLNPNENYVAINDYFPVIPEETYVFSWFNSAKIWISNFNPIIAFYNANKAHVGYVQVSSGLATIPENVYYIRVSMSKSQFTGNNYFQIEKGSTHSDYEEYFDRIYLDNAYIDTQYLGENYERTVINNVIRVGSSDDCDFSKLREALDSISGNSEYNQFTVYVEEGTYDLASEITAEEIEGTYAGVKIPDYCTVIGLGDRNKVIISCRLANPDVNISALNFSNTASLENVTVISENCRYTIHDDSAVANGQNGYFRSLKNCVLKGVNNYYNSVYGAGLRENATWEFENCIFDASEVDRNTGNGIAWFVHNNSGFEYPCYINFKNCRFITSLNEGAVTLRTISTSANDMITYVQFEGCKLGTGEFGLYLREENASQYGAGCLFRVSGYANINDTFHIQNSDGADYSDHVDFLN